MLVVWCEREWGVLSWIDIIFSTSPANAARFYFWISLTMRFAICSLFIFASLISTRLNCFPPRFFNKWRIFKRAVSFIFGGFLMQIAIYLAIFCEHILNTIFKCALKEKAWNMFNNLKDKRHEKFVWYSKSEFEEFLII